MLKIGDASQRERAAAAAVRSLPRPLRRDVDRVTREVAAPLVRREAAGRALGSASRQIAAAARYSTTGGLPGVAFGGSRAVTSSGVAGRVLVGGLEYGSRGKRLTTYVRRPAGVTAHPVTRNVTAQFFPPAQEPGRFIGPAVEASTDEVVEAWLGAVETNLVRALDAD